MKSLLLLPKLKTLELYVHLGPSSILQHVAILPNVTELVISVDDVNGGWLTELATKMRNLVQFEHWGRVDRDLCKIIKSFENLQVLSIINIDEHYTLPQNIVFPPKIKRIEFGQISMNWKSFESIVKKLTFLEEFDICWSDLQFS